MMMKMMTISLLRVHPVDIEVLGFHLEMEEGKQIIIIR